MTGISAYSTDGGTASEITYPLAQTHPIEDIEDVDNAIGFAMEALEAADKLESMSLNEDKADKLSTKLLNVAVENYIKHFEIPRAALEDYPVVPYEGEESKQEQNNSNSSNSTTGDEQQKATKLKKVIAYLFAIVERVFKAVFDLFQQHYTTARKLMPLTKQYIGEVDGLSSSVAMQVNIRDRSLMNALHIDGIAPKKIPELYNKLAQTLVAQRSFSPVDEITRLVNSARDKDQDRIIESAEKLRSKLNEGLNASLDEIDPSTISVFNEKKSDAATYYASEPMFGQTYIVGVVAKQINASGTFRYECAIRRDPEVSVRVTVFPVLTPDEIRSISRISLSICENIIRFSRDEELMQKILREAAFLKRKETDKRAVIALRNIGATGQNSYIVYMRYTVRTMQSLMRWCAASIARYQEFKQNG